MQLITLDTLDAELDARGIQHTPLSLTIPESTTFEEWADVGKILCRREFVIRWMIADWLAFGERKYGEVKEFARMNGWAEQTMYNWKRVAASIEVTDRREDLSFSHHEAVASLKPKQQREWLEKAHTDCITVGDLRNLVRSGGGEIDAKKPDGKIFHWPQDRSLPGLIPWLEKQPSEYWTENMHVFWKAYFAPAVALYNRL